MCVHSHYKDFETMQNQIDTNSYTITPNFWIKSHILSVFALNKFFIYLTTKSSNLKASAPPLTKNKVRLSDLFFVKSCGIKRRELRKAMPCFIVRATCERSAEVFCEKNEILWSKNRRHVQREQVKTASSFPPFK